MHTHWLYRLFLSCIALLTVGAVCADVVRVTPQNMAAAGWKAVVRAGGTGETKCEFATGPGAVPAGTGSLHLEVASCETDPLPKVYLGTNAFNGIRLDEITQFKLYVCPASYDLKGAQPVTVELAIAKGDKVRLCTFYPWGFKPGGYYGKMQWREVDLMGTYASWAITNIDGEPTQGNWNWLVKRYPGACITIPPAMDWPHGTLPGTGLNIKIGAGKAASRTRNNGAWWRESSRCDSYVDKLVFAYRDATGKEVENVYDFEPQ